MGRQTNLTLLLHTFISINQFTCVVVNYMLIRPKAQTSDSAVCPAIALFVAIVRKYQHTNCNGVIASFLAMTCW